MSLNTNYAKEYSRELSQAFPYVLYFGDLYNTPNNGRFPIGKSTVLLWTLAC